MEPKPISSYSQGLTWPYQLPPKVPKVPPPVAQAPLRVHHRVRLGSHWRKHLRQRVLWWCFWPGFWYRLEGGEEGNIYQSAARRYMDICLVVPYAVALGNMDLDHTGFGNVYHYLSYCGLRKILSVSRFVQRASTNSDDVRPLLVRDVRFVQPPMAVFDRSPHKFNLNKSQPVTADDSRW